MSIGIQQQLQRYARPLRTAAETNDIDFPFSFKTWFESYQGIIPGQEYSQYNQYLVDWYKSKAEITTDQNLQIKLNYLKLIKQLQLFFPEQEVENWYNGIDINNDKELFLAIPYFAKKLKDIALYYLNLRENIKLSKIKYNLVGSNTGLNLQLQEFLLNNYTKKPNTSIAIPASIWRSAPDLSAVRDDINIQIEELYDTYSYFDHSPTMPVSAYYEINTPAVEQYFNSLGLTLTSAEWIFKTGVFEISGNEIIDTINVSEELTNKYLGSNKYSSLTVATSTETDFYNIPITIGNNFFYWPIGPYKSSVVNQPLYLPQPLSAAGLETLATAGSSLEFADTIFIKTKNTIAGAWLRKQLYEENSPTMKALLNAENVTRFRYPYPGFGLSAEDIAWTGPGLETNSRFFFLTDTFKKAVEEQYWSVSPGLTSYTPIHINSTTLIDSKAQPSTDYNTADKIRVWPESPSFNEASYTGPVEEAWLYKMQQTDISVASGSDTTIVWPYFKINPQDDFPLNSVPSFVNTCCLPTPLSSIEFKYSVASNNINSADKIYKIQNYQNTSEEATECAWLSGKEIFYNNYKTTAVLQPGLNTIFTPGAFTKFIWQGNNNTPVDSVFQNFEHQSDCQFVTTPNTTYNEHKLCTCKQVLFTPFGHPGNIFTDNGSYCDYIVEAPITGNFNISQWRDTFNRPALSSDSFTWFKTKNKIGWGSGEWITGIANSKLLLKQGQVYLYYRQNTKTLDPVKNIFPEYVIRHPYNNFNSNNFKWIQGVKNTDNTWDTSNTNSNLILYPGDYIVYSRQSAQTFSVLASTLSSVIINENRGSAWTNFDYLTIETPNNDIATQPQQFVLSFPDTNLYINTTDQQYPALDVNNFVSVLAWSISAPSTPIRYFYDTPLVTVVPTVTGTYSFGVTAMSATTVPPQVAYLSATGTFYYTNTGYYFFNKIPAVTAIPLQTVAYVPTAAQIAAPSFVLNTPLYGWDYNTSTETTKTGNGNYGARPVWVETKVDKNQYTDFKGIEAWGNYTRLEDSYNFINQPETSNIILSTGSYIEYHRVTNTDLNWQQPLTQKILVDRNNWSAITINTSTSSNLQSILNTNSIELIAQATLSSSPLTLQSTIDNEPTEIYYNALNPFTWSITAIPVGAKTINFTSSAQQITNITRSWNNFTHRYYPNIAILPTIQNLSSVDDMGGFFLPTNLGVTQYLNKDYTINTSISSAAVSGIFENPNEYIGGRGLTKQDQQTPYEIALENSIWLKEPAIAGPIAGTIKKNLFKKYQKFIPYQTRYETNPNIRYGLSTPASRQTPWTGPTDSDWSDPLNFPKSFTGEINVDTWANDQLLKRSNLQLDNWCTDVFGNQYGLYKNTQNVSSKDRKNVLGEIWIRKNSQRVYPGSVGLSGIFDTYLNVGIYDELVRSGIKHIDVFFDTLYIQTTGAVIFERIVYEYPTDRIFSLADEARYISLAMPVETNLNKEIQNVSLADYTFAKAGETWFFPERKQAIQSVCGLSGNVITPELYRYELNSLNLTKAFPTLQEDSNIIKSLSSLDITSINSPILTHNNLKKEYIMSIAGQKQNGQDILLEFKIKDLPTLALNNITVYDSTPLTIQTLPPQINQPLYIELAYGQDINVQLVPVNGSAIFEKIEFPSWADISSSGLISGDIPSPGTYYFTFKATNNVGPTFYALTVLAIEPQPPILTIDATQTTGNIPLSVVFTGINLLPQSAAPVTSWYWNLTSGSTPDYDTQTVTYTYQSPGTYTVNLTGLNVNYLRTAFTTITAYPNIGQLNTIFYRDFITNQTLNHGIGSNIDFYRTTTNDSNIPSLTGTATFINSVGEVQVVTENNQPRFDYDPLTLEPKGLLFEQEELRIFGTGPWGARVTSSSLPLTALTITNTTSAWLIPAQGRVGTSSRGHVVFSGTGTVLVSSNWSSGFVDVISGADNYPYRTEVARPWTTGTPLGQSAVVLLSTTGNVQYLEFRDYLNSVPSKPVYKGKTPRSVVWWPDENRPRRTADVGQFNVSLSNKGTIVYEASIDITPVLSGSPYYNFGDNVNGNAGFFTLLNTAQNIGIRLYIPRVQLGTAAAIIGQLCLGRVGTSGTMSGALAYNYPLTGTNTFWKDLSGETPFKIAFSYNNNTLNAYVNGLYAGQTYNLPLPFPESFDTFKLVGENNLGSRINVRKVTVINTDLDNDSLQLLSTL